MPFDLPPVPAMIQQTGGGGNCFGSPLSPVRVAVPRKNKPPKYIAHGGATFRCTGNVDTVTATTCLELEFPRGFVQMDCNLRRLGVRLNLQEPPRKPLVIGKQYRVGISYPCGIVRFLRSRKWRVTGTVQAWNEHGTAIDPFSSEPVLLKC